MNKSPLVSIIVPNYNGRQYLDTCLSSILKTKYTQFELIMVDDCSTDESISIIEKYARHHANIKVLRNKKNIGAAASRNKAAKIAKGDILVFLDNDTEVDKNWLREIVKTLLEDKKIGACQAKLMDFHQRKNIQLVGVRLWAATGWGLPIGQGERDKGQYEKQDIIAISAALAVKKDVYSRLDGFDEDEAIVTEDLDLSWRIWLLGYKIVLCPSSIVYHWTKNTEMRKNMFHTNKTIYYHLTKNSLMSIIKNYEVPNMLVFGLKSITISNVRSLYILIKKHDSSALIALFQAYFYILTHITKIMRKRKKMSQLRRVPDKFLMNNVILDNSFLFIYKKYYA